MIRDSKIRTLLILTSIVALLVGTAYLIFNNSGGFQSRDVIVVGDPPVEDYTPAVLGHKLPDTVYDKEASAILEISLIKYKKSLITFDQLLMQELEQFRRSLLIKESSVANSYYRVMYSDSSSTQIYYQSDTDKTRTVIFKVVHRTSGNNVSIVYDGSYKRIVSAGDTLDKLNTYADDDSVEIIGVGTN